MRKSVSKRVREELVTDAAVNAVRSLRSNHAGNALTEFQRKILKRRAGDKLPLPIEASLTEIEKRLVIGRIEALLCYEMDIRNYGRVLPGGTRVATMLVGVKDAADITGIGRTRIQDLADSGFLPCMEVPYHNPTVLVRRECVRIAKEGIADHRQ